VPITSVFRRTVLAPGAALLLPAYLSACFHYVPAAVEPLPGPRTEVRVHLAQPLRVPLGEFTLEDVATIEGIVAETTGDTLGVWAKWLYPRLGTRYDALGATFHVSRGSISRLDQYRFSTTWTAVTLGVAGAVVVGFFALIGLATAGETGAGNIPETTSVRGWGIRE